MVMRGAAAMVLTAVLLSGGIVPAAAQALRVGAAAPDLAGGPWINSAPLTTPGLRGRAGRGLTIVGVHAPEFAWERNYDRVVDATKRFRLRYPVVQDNEHAIWKRFGVWAWPTKLLVDRRGVVRYRHVGEGAYAEMDAQIQALLAEAG